MGSPGSDKASTEVRFLPLRPNRTRNAQYQADWYKRNRSKKIRQARIVARAYEDWFRTLKATFSCADCPESHPACLHFHHLDPTQKTMEVSKMAARQFAKVKVLAEIDKCVVLCANCHAKRHYNARVVESVDTQVLETCA